MMRPGECDPYAEAIRRTRASIVERARRYRDVMLFAAAVVLASVGSVAASGAFAGLAGLLFLPAAWTFWLLVDRLLLNRWRAALMRDWQERRIDVSALRQALAVNPVLPRETLDGMLGTLPQAADMRAEREIDMPMRRMVAAAVARSDVLRARVLAVKAVLLCLGATAIAAWLLLAVICRGPAGDAGPAHESWAAAIRAPRHCCPSQRLSKATVNQA